LKFARYAIGYPAKKGNHMMKFALAAAAAAAMFTAAPSFAGSSSDQGQIITLAQATIEVGRDRDDRRYRDRRRDDVTLGIGPGGVRVGPRERCRTVTTMIERDDGRRVKRTERRCD
jgi:hypothetical protein